MLRFLAAEPELARLCMVEPVAAGGEIAARYRATMQDFVTILKAGRPEHGGERALPEATEETLVGGIVSLIVREISAGRTADLEKLLPDLVELILAPYLGVEEAERLARAFRALRSPPSRRRRPRSARVAHRGRPPGRLPRG